MTPKYLLKFVCLFLLGIVIGILASNYKLVVSFVREIIGNTVSQWASDFVIAEIPCSYDDKTQKVYYYRSNKNGKTPLIVSLHSWSGDYKQYDPLAELVKNEDWNYIHPDFRGPNNSPEACMSEAVIHDIDDAITYSLKTGNVDENKIIVVGASGGGMAVLGMYLRSSYDLYYCMAWNPISDLEAWYYQSLFAENEYWKDILKSTDSGNSLNVEEAKKRSPLFNIPPKRDLGMIEICAGVNDGYTGSVSILHSLLFYNKMAIHYGFNDAIIPDQDINMLLSRSINSNGEGYSIDDRKIFYKKMYRNIRLFIFDGTHEMLSNYAFTRIIEIVSKW